jgi:LL-diaminopimelate aminotransferase
VKPRIAARVGQLPAYPMAHIPRLKRELIAKGVDVIDLGAGDADFMPPQVAIDSLKTALANPAMHRYGFQIGLQAFRDAIVRYHKRRFGTEFDAAAEVAPLIGSKEGICHFAQAVCGPGDVAIVPEPGYACYIGGAVLAGATAHIVPLTAQNNFLVELSEVPADILKRTRVLFLNYPNNPTAAVAPRDYLERTVAICRERGIVLCYDNPYCEIAFDGYVAPSIFEIEGAREVAVEFHSLSKSFSMTGWRVAWAVGNRDLLHALTQVKTFTDTGPFLALQHASAEVLDRSAALVQAPVAAFTSRRDVLVRALRKVGFEAPVPKATLYLWVPMPDGVEAVEFASVALKEEGVIVLPGVGFGTSAEGYMRLALTVPEARLEEAADRMGRVLARA